MNGASMSAKMTIGITYPHTFYISISNIFFICCISILSISGCRCGDRTGIYMRIFPSIQGGVTHWYAINIYGDVWV